MEHTVEITGLAFGGRGVGRIGGKVVFVPFTAPGDTARVRITSEKKSFSEGELIELVRPSPERVAPLCPLFGVCGGCALQHMGYASQVRWKQTIFEETLKRIGGVAPEFDAPVPSPEAFGYRSRASFHVDKGRWGFYAAGSHRVVDVEDCPILSPAVNSAYKGIRQRLSGRLRSLYSVDVGASGEGGAAAAFHVSGDKGFDWKGALRGVEGLSGFEVWFSPSKKGKGKRIIAEDDSRLVYAAGGLRFEAGISVFTQVNRSLNPALMERVVEYAGLSGVEKAVDLCCGAGNLSLPLAKRACSVTGVEENGAAVDLARKNAELNSIKNARFIRSDSLGWVQKSIKSLEKEDVDMVVLDPPRGGDPDVAKALSGLKPRKIIYVSCSPPTLARDVSFLAGCGYRAFRAGLFDMFPQTYHIESVTGLELSGQ
ncbi:MAG: class I SAM-dependent RNA methyltransferase [Deltaproteobacteria bacterium]|nr:class I SAM-dependent RNA methyltransferase [Deltaproteobacteria bacterium]